MTGPSIAVAFALSAVLVPPQAQPTPQDCVRQGRELTMKRQKERSPLTAAIVRQIDAERVTLVRECAAAFDVARATNDQLAALLELYTEAQQPELAEGVIRRGMTPDGVDMRTRADVLSQAIRYLLRQPKSAERNARAEEYVDQLDRFPSEYIEQKLSAHQSLNGYYRGDDIDAGIIKHSTWLIDTARTVTPEQRTRFGSGFTAAYVNLAEALAGQGENDKALDLLRRAASELSDLPYVESRVKPALARYSLVGKPAAPVAASVWLNRAGTAAPIDVKGKVTLVQFTAHWCGPCKESYPGMKRLEARFKDRGLQVVFYTRTYGYFESERDLTREQEIERDRTYFAGYGFTHPIAIGTPSFTLDANGRRAFQKDPVEEAFGVGGIPQINVIDAQGNLRLIMIGYDDANEEKLAGFIESLLKKT